ncbi:MAG: DUF402 domain-containing protein [Butyribacter sp.]|nr:DUF402 domain-containing protein [bacterium]MDY3854525.1 DUF402 domain-containing protein [Butyribacter sp.]
MKQIRLFRRRFLPDELTELKDDRIIYMSDDVLITKWNVLKPRKDISNGVSAYFLKHGIKVSKIYDAGQNLVYWYCDIIDTRIDNDTNSYTFEDLLIDVLVFPDGHVEVVDMDEFADIMEKNVLDKRLEISALRRTDYLLRLIYSGKFSQLTDYIEKAEKELHANQ